MFLILIKSINMKKLILGCCLLGWGTILFAQSGSVSSGGTATGTDGTVTYSVGQSVYTTASGSPSDGVITQGLQQPYEIFVNVVETGIDASVSLYPNPTKEFVILNVANVNAEDFTYEMFDIQGKILAGSKLVSNETKISMTDLANATYFVKVLNLNKESKTFKIIKTQ